MTDDPTETRRGKRLAVALATVLVTLAALELVARFGLGGLVAPGLGENARRLEGFREYVWNRRHALYAPRAYVGYALHADVPGVNSRGFRDVEWRVERPAGTLRIACLGGSTTEGESEGRKGAYPFLLERALGERPGAPPAEVLNFGVSGWTSTESAVNYFLTVQDYAPDVVVVHHAVNDVRPRMWPGFRPDYAHFRRPWTEPRYGLSGRVAIRASAFCAALALKRHAYFNLNYLVGVPLADESALDSLELDPATTWVFRRNLRTIAEHVLASGGVPLLTTMPYSADERFYQGFVGRHIRPGLVQHNQVVRELAADEGFLLLDLERLWSERAAELAPLFKDHVHVRREGNRVKAEMIADFLAAQGLLGG